RHVGRNRLELAAKIGRRVRLQVPTINGAQPAMQKQEDQRDIARRLPFLSAQGLRLEQFRQVQAYAEQAKRAEPQNIAAVDAVAVLAFPFHSHALKADRSCRREVRLSRLAPFRAIQSRRVPRLSSVFL